LQPLLDPPDDACVLTIHLRIHYQQVME
jgi:hypothetical protein